MMNRGVVLGVLAALVAPAMALAQAPLERGRYLVDTVMTCHNCHTLMGPNGPQFDRALSGGLRFDEALFDVTASNITPDRETGIGNWSDAEIKTALQEGTRPTGHHLAPIMPSGSYGFLPPRDLDGLVAYLRSLPAVSNAVPGPVTALLTAGKERRYATMPSRSRGGRNPYEPLGMIGARWCPVGRVPSCSAVLISASLQLPMPVSRSGVMLEAVTSNRASSKRSPPESARSNCGPLGPISVWQL